MDVFLPQNSEIEDMIPISDTRENTDSDSKSISPIMTSALGAQATKAGLNTQELQSLIAEFPKELNKMTWTKSGTIVRTPIPQYKGFIAEKYHELTLQINASANGITSDKFIVRTNGPLPDGTYLSPIDMHSDLVAYYKKSHGKNPQKLPMLN